MRSTLILLFMTLTSVACGGGGTSPPGNRDDGNNSESSVFDFSTTQTIPFDLIVTAQGAPLKGAIVLVTDATYLPSPESGLFAEDLVEGRVFFRGITDEGGRVRSDLRVLNRVNELDIVVNLNGFVGPFTEEELREIAGPLAPSARVRLSRDDINGLQITLSKDS